LFVRLAGCPRSDDPPGVEAPDAAGGPPIPDAVSIDAAIPQNEGMVPPTAITKANTRSGSAWIELGDASWSCLNTPSPDAPSTGTISLTGAIVDFQTGNGVGNAMVTAWRTNPLDTAGTATTSDVAATRGDFSMTLSMLPAGTRRYGFTINAPSFLTTRVLARFYQPGLPATDEITAISEATATALPAFIGITRDPSKAAYIGTMRDCNGDEVSNVVVGISDQMTFFNDAGGQTFYFSAGASSLPVRHNVSPSMNRDGLFTVLDVPPGPFSVIQVWGFRDTAELASGQMTLLAALPAGGEANMMVTANLEPLRN
jgi:hypothetical protein